MTYWGNGVNEVAWTSLTKRVNLWILDSTQIL